MANVRFLPTVLRTSPSTEELTGLEDIDPVLRRLFQSRGIVSAEEVDYSLNQLEPISSLQGVDEAVSLLLEHRDKKIIVIGDFDADGATSTALVMRCLREFGITDIDYLVPNRFRFGYGLTPEIVKVASLRSPDLLVTVDNGVSSIDGVDEAHRLGIKVLITDHNLPGAVLPAADAMVNPTFATAISTARIWLA